MNELAAKEQEIEKSIGSVQTAATSLIITSHDTYSEAGDWLVTIKKVKKTIEEFFKPMKDAAHKSWKAVCDKEKQELDKLSPALNHLNKQMTDWNVAQERLRRLEEDRLRREAEKAEEDRRLQAAIEAEQAGEKEEATAILEEPLYVPPPIVEKTVPKQAGLAMTTTWRWRLKDINLVPRQFLNINETALNAHVKNLKDRSNVPGIEVYPESSMRGVRS
ncbi:MAG: hypothetical protein DDT31_01564 [Syntrophomonadaceae bacterium]|nr:hypothetical protein [Bacillota bacterium]